MDLTNGKMERSQANIQEENQKKKNPREVFKQEDYLYWDLQSWSQPPEGHWCRPLPENYPLPENSPLPENAPLTGKPPLAV